MVKYKDSFIQKNNRCRKRISERDFWMGKRETGEKPVRSRHCDKGVQPSGAGSCSATGTFCAGKVMAV